MSAQVGVRAEPGGAGSVNKLMRGHFEKAKVRRRAMLREFRVPGEAKVGETVARLDLRAERQSSTSSGRARDTGSPASWRGTTSAAAPRAHGSMFHRAPGSIGASAFPSRTFPGMRGPGRSGRRADRRSGTSGVVRVDAEQEPDRGARRDPRAPPAALSSTIRKAQDGRRSDARRHAAAKAKGEGDRRRRCPRWISRDVDGEQGRHDDACRTASSRRLSSATSCTRPVRHYRASRTGRHARHEEPLRGRRRRQEALEAEAHGPRPARIDALAAAGGKGRHRSGSASARLRLRSAAQGGPCAARCDRRSALKVKDDRLVVVDALCLDSAKTKDLAAMLDRRGPRDRSKVLIVHDGEDAEPVLRGAQPSAHQGGRRAGRDERLRHLLNHDYLVLS